MRRRSRSSTLLQRVAAGTGVEAVVALERQVDDLAEAIAENAALEVPLTEIVRELEQALVGPLEHRLRFVADRSGH